MKLSRLFVASLAVVALLSSCGGSSSPTNVTPSLDNAPPAAPTGLTMVQEGISRTLVWEASSAPDLAGYDVYVYSPDPLRDNSYVLLASTSETTNSFVIPSMWADDGNYFRIVAVDQASNHSGMSSPLMLAEFGGSGLPQGFNGEPVRVPVKKNP